MLLQNKTKPLSKCIEPQKHSKIPQIYTQIIYSPSLCYSAQDKYGRHLYCDNVTEMLYL